MTCGSRKYFLIECLVLSRMEKFTKLGLSKELTDVLEHSGFKEPTEIQEKTIPIALAGRDIIGGSATGSGKTLAFASAIIENLKQNGEIQAIILTPTRELAEQVATMIRNFSKNKALSVLAVYGGVKIDTQIRKLSTTDILVGTPGRILDHISRGTLKLKHIKFLVLDEVDRMFDMGFSRDVERIINECPTKRQTMMFSATISSDIDYLAKKYTKNPAEIAVNSYVDPSKLKQVYYDVPNNKKFSLLVHLLKQEESNFVLVFCSTRRNVDFVADNLIRNNIKAKAIHGGMEQKKRLRVLDEFKKKGTGVLVCTDVAARGLDIENVSHVYNYDIPSEPKDYIHRIGRTARAGKEGKAITILASRDYERFGNLIQSKEINITSKQLPKLEIVRIRIDQGDRSRGRNFDKSSRTKYSKSRSRESRGGPRRQSYSGGHRRSSNRSNSYGRDDGPRKYDGKSSSRDRPRRYGSQGGDGSKPYNRERPRRYGSQGGDGSKPYNRERPRRYGSQGGGARTHGGSRRDKPREYSSDNRDKSRGYGRDNRNQSRSYDRGPRKYGRDSSRGPRKYNNDSSFRGDKPRGRSYSRDGPRSHDRSGDGPRRYDKRGPRKYGRDNRSKRR